MHCKSYSHFFSKKFQHICVSVDVNFNESLTNDIVSFEQLGPGHASSEARNVVPKVSGGRTILTERSTGGLTTFSAPASPIWRGGPPLLPFAAAPLPFLSCILSCLNSRHKTLHFGENLMKIGPKLKILSKSKGQYYVYSIFEVFIVEWDYTL